jgi:hypothetical protein
LRDHNVSVNQFPFKERIRPVLVGRHNEDVAKTFKKRTQSQLPSDAAQEMTWNEVDCLGSGSSLSIFISCNFRNIVSLLLGHSSVKITERHYTPFCKARQEQLAVSVKLAWRKPNQSVQQKKTSSLKKHARRQDSGV